MRRHDLVLEVADHQLLAARGRLPRDELERIAVRVLAQLAQLAREAAPAHVVQADLLVQRAADRAHRLAAQRAIVRGNTLTAIGFGKNASMSNRPSASPNVERGAVQHVVAGGERLHRRGDLDLLAALDGRARPLVDAEAATRARMFVDRMRRRRLPWLRNARWSWNGRSTASAPPG